MNIRQYRKKSGMTQQELADKAEVARATINRYEAGTRVPDVDIAAKIADALKCSVDDLIRKDA